MYSLLPTMHGANAQLLIQALNELVNHYRGNDRQLSEELFRFSLLLHRAELIPPEEKRRVEEKLSMWDHLIEQDPRIQQIRAESELIGETRGEAKGETRGIVAMQGAILGMLQERFPLLVEKAKADIESIQSLNALQQLIVELSITRDETSAQRAIAAYLP